MNTHFVQHLEKLNPNSPLFKLLNTIQRETNQTELLSANGSINFVGIIIHSKNIIYSFPKHYNVNSDNIYLDIKLLYDVIVANSNSMGLDYDNDKQFPIINYMNIHNYYSKNGLYVDYERYDTIQPNGKISWLKMMRRSNKIINNNSLVLSPIIYDKKTTSLVFLSECMDFILYEAYDKYLRFIDNRFRYDRKYYNNDFSDIEYVIAHLYDLLSSTFKDTTKELILNCINYFQWKGSFGKTFQLFINDFNFYWQNMVHNYLNGKNIIPKYIYNDKNVVSAIELTIQKSNTFESEKLFYIDSLAEKKHQIYIDHFLCTEQNLYLFDSKYYMNTNKLNYKQISYYYFIKNKKKYSNKTIYTLLIYPTSGEKSIELNINRSHIPKDRLVLSSLYLNIKEVMKYYVY
mgnify:FL=1